jgi:1-deoxy-D-xylulose-5-phosphate reductoisomerase
VSAARPGGPVRLSVLGSTGSIGRSALSLALFMPERIKVAALAARGGGPALAAQIRLFRPGLVSVADEWQRVRLLGLLGDLANKPDMVVGPEGLRQAAAESGAAAVLSAIVGAAGLPPTWAAVKKGLKVALANKESLVLAGDLIMEAAADGALAPVDSEHGAVFQALGGRLRSDDLRRVILTASGGPFRGWKKEDLERVTPRMALRHPTWAMGPKISCDSATLMNKGLEVIEAHHLFGLPYDRIGVAVQPASLVHSLAEFADGSVLAHLGPADMRLPIAYALSHPERWPLLDLAGRTPPGPAELLAAAGIGDFGSFTSAPLPDRVEFEPPDTAGFPCLELAVAAGRAGGTAPAVLNGANEEAVGAFLDGDLSFTGIPAMVGWCLERLPARPLKSVGDALDADREARIMVAERLGRPRP